MLEFVTRPIRSVLGLIELRPIRSALGLTEHDVVKSVDEAQDIKADIADAVRAIKDDTAYNHYSLLRTIEQVWHLGYLGYAGDGANVSSMTNLLQH